MSNVTMIFDKSSIYWKNSSICQWLNGTFYNSSFTDTEKSFIASTEISNESYYVFLLSKTEAENYFANNTARKCRRINFNVNEANEGYTTWWLRTCYVDNGSGVYSVNYDGKIVQSVLYRYNNPNSLNYYLVRPAMWVNI